MGRTMSAGAVGPREKRNRKAITGKEMLAFHRRWRENVQRPKLQHAEVKRWKPEQKSVQAPMDQVGAVAHKFISELNFLGLAPHCAAIAVPQVLNLPGLHSASGSNVF